jgi:hypothetical protein
MQRHSSSQQPFNSSARGHFNPSATATLLYRIVSTVSMELNYFCVCRTLTLIYGRDGLNLLLAALHPQKIAKCKRASMPFVNAHSSLIYLFLE